MCYLILSVIVLHYMHLYHMITLAFSLTFNMFHNIAHLSTIHH